MPIKEAMEFVLSDEPLEALKLLPENSKLRKKLLKKLDHMFNPKAYLQKYADDPMGWRPEMVGYDRHTWILEEAREAMNLIDLGCYEGSLVRKFGKDAKGVEICKEAVKLGKERRLNIVQGDATEWKDLILFDAVCACELIEHVVSPKKLIKAMLSLVSQNGWCYVTTPNGCFDPEGTLASWKDVDALIDHVRTYNKKKVEKLLKGLEYKIVENEKELWFKFRKKKR